MKLNELELIQLFRQPGGMEFVRFCNEVIRATCWARGVAQSEVSTTLRTDIRDGGVDSRIGRGIAGEEFGYFETPSVWQFKAADESKVTQASLRREVRKPFARQCIETGDAYRICICAHLTVPKKESLEKVLRAEVKKINSAAPAPKVLGLGDIVVVANSYAALVMRYGIARGGTYMLFDVWAQAITNVTGVFVPNASFDGTKSMISNHVDFAAPVQDAVIPLRGQSGVGKTRTVYESLRGHAGANTLVLYSSDEEELEGLVTMLANDESQYAVIVADECSLSTRVTLSRRLSGCKHRIRCISIDNSTERSGGAAAELEVTKPNSAETQGILHANFPSIPFDRLRAYAELSEGFIGIAADMCCHYDTKIKQAGDISPIVGHVEDYYKDRLGNEEKQRAVEVVALLKRVKRKGQVPTQLDQLCELTHTNKHDIEQELTAIKDAPGFVERGELYYRVTPEIIAMVAFEAAWKRWAEGREEEFLSRIPEEIQESFLQRVSEGRNVGVQKTVQQFFRQFADSFSSRDLADLGLVNKFIRLIKTDPAQYLPRLREIIGSATELELTRERQPAQGSWGPRRQLVWLAESFIQFPEFWTDCEEILYTLARHECEPEIGNNATKTWQRLFRMQLSGTALPLPARLVSLETRIGMASADDADLVAGALGTILDFHSSRLLGPAVIAGRIVPSDWRPSPSEFQDLVPRCLRLIEQATQHPVELLARKAKEIILSDIEFLVRRGWIDHLRPIVAASSLDENDRALLVGRLRHFELLAKDSGGLGLGEDYAQKLRAWISELEPHSFHARLIETVGIPSWGHFGRETEWQSRLEGLAAEMVRDKSVLESQVDWLTSRDANSSFEFGYALGTVDGRGTYLDVILARSASREAGFARGYIAGLIRGAHADPKPINEQLDSWQGKDALFSFQLALAGGKPVRAFDRAVRLIETGHLPAYQLRNFTHWVGDERITLIQVSRALEILTPRANQGEHLASDVAMDFLGARSHDGQLPELLLVNGKAVWDALSAFTDHPGRESFWWGKVLYAVAPGNPQLAIGFACKALVGENFDMRNEAAGLLTSWANNYPNEVMAAVGRIMLDPATGVWFLVSKFPVFTALPLSILFGWLEKVGAEGARRIARHLPPPYIDGDGNPKVPELTAWVLSHFEDDDRTFNQFCAGVHSGQMYMGNIAGRHESEAHAARLFFNHNLRRIREWARLEHASALEGAQVHREWEDEMNL